METDKDIGGVCGYMGLKPERNIDESGYIIYELLIDIM